MVSRRIKNCNGFKTSEMLKITSLSQNNNTKEGKGDEVFHKFQQCWESGKKLTKAKMYIAVSRVTSKRI